MLQLLPNLPVIPDYCLLMVVHLSPVNKSWLPEILSRLGSWKVKQAKDGDSLEGGLAYIAPPDFHLVLSGDKLHLSSSKPIRMQRPSVDVLFESVAKSQGASAIGVLLSGAGRDGSDGLRYMKQSGARTIVQDPAEAPFPSMPEHGIETGCADFIVPTRALAPQISLLCAQR